MIYCLSKSLLSVRVEENYMRRDVTFLFNTMEYGVYCTTRTVVSITYDTRAYAYPYMLVYIYSYTC